MEIQIYLNKDDHNHKNKALKSEFLNLIGRTLILSLNKIVHQFVAISSFYI